MESKTHNSKIIPQLKWPGLYSLLALPIGWWLVVIYVITPKLLAQIITLNVEINSYALNLITRSCYLFEFILAILALRCEGQSCTWAALKSRITLRWGEWKTCGLFLVVYETAFTFTIPLIATSKNTAVLSPLPDWFPASQNPLKEVNGVEDAMPGIELSTNILFLQLFLFGLMGSLPLAMLAHYLGNFGLAWPLAIKLALFGQN